MGSLPSLLLGNDFLTLIPHLTVLGTGEPSGHLGSRAISDRDFVFSPSDILLYLGDRSRFAPILTVLGPSRS